MDTQNFNSQLNDQNNQFSVNLPGEVLCLFGIDEWRIIQKAPSILLQDPAKSYGLRVRGSVFDADLKELSKLANMKNMIRFDLFLDQEQIGLTEDGLSYIGNLQYLRYLNLYNCYFSAAGLIFFNKLSCVETLVIQSECLDDRCLKRIGILHRLTELSIDGFFSDRGLLDLSWELKNLKKLEVQSCIVSAQGLRGFLNGPGAMNLKTLSIKCHKINRDDAVAIQNDFPKCRIGFVDYGCGTNTPRRKRKPLVACQGCKELISDLDLECKKCGEVQSTIKYINCNDSVKGVCKYCGCLNRIMVFQPFSDAIVKRIKCRGCGADLCDACYYEYFACEKQRVNDNAVFLGHFFAGLSCLMIGIIAKNLVAWEKLQSIIGWILIGNLALFFILSILIRKCARKLCATCWFIDISPYKQVIAQEEFWPVSRNNIHSIWWLLGILSLWLFFFQKR